MEDGELNPEEIHTPAVFIDKIFKSDPNCPYSEKRIEKLTLKTLDSEQKPQKGLDVRLKIMRRAAKEVRDGMNVNLGIGIPMLLPSVLPPDVHINLQS